MKENYFGMRPEEKLRNIPQHLRPHHEFCFYLHDRMVALLIEYETSGAHSWLSERVASAAFEQGVVGEIDVLELLRKAGLNEAGKHLLLGHLILGLTSDLLHFLFESLCCLEKRKFAVALSLLRKPFKENMLFLAWLLGDPEDFLRRFEKDNYSTLNGLQPQRRQELLGLAIEQLAIKDAFDGDLIERMIFSKDSKSGFEPLWQKATHLITSQGINLKTEDLNINFIFNNASSDHLFEAIYEKLPYLMLFLVQLSLRTFAEVAPTNIVTTNHLILASMGTYECLVDVKPRRVSNSLIKSLRPMLKCLHCTKPFRFDRINTMSMYLAEEVACKTCGMANEVPLYWLLAQSGVQVVPDPPSSAFDKLMNEMKSESVDEV